jgi:hypothetical protein
MEVSKTKVELFRGVTSYTLMQLKMHDPDGFYAFCRNLPKLLENNKTAEEFLASLGNFANENLAETKGKEELLKFVSYFKKEIKNANKEEKAKYIEVLIEETFSVFTSESEKSGRIRE